MHKHSGVVLLQTGRPVTLLEHAARHCFWQMKLPQLKTCCNESKLHPITPDLLGHLEIRIVTTHPDLSKDELTDFLEMRCVRKHVPMVGLDMEIVEAMFPPEDMKVIEELWNVCLFNMILYLFLRL